MTSKLIWVHERCLLVRAWRQEGARIWVESWRLALQGAVELGTVELAGIRQGVGEDLAQFLVHLSWVEVAADVSHATDGRICKHGLRIVQKRTRGPRLRLLLTEHLDGYQVYLLQRVRDVQHLPAAPNQRAAKLALRQHVCWRSYVRCGYSWISMGERWWLRQADPGWRRSQEGLAIRRWLTQIACNCDSGVRHLVVPGTARPLLTIWQSCTGLIQWCCSATSILIYCGTGSTLNIDVVHSRILHLRVGSGVLGLLAAVMDGLRLQMDRLLLRLHETGNARGILGQ